MHVNKLHDVLFFSVNISESVIQETRSLLDTDSEHDRITVHL